MDKVKGWSTVNDGRAPITVVGEIWNESPSGLTIQGRSTDTIGLGVQDFFFRREDIVGVEHGTGATA